MRIIRVLGNVALWIGAVLGVFAGGVWVAGQFGWVQPLIVISGSMEPSIHTGDLIISRNLATSDVEVGDVVSLQSELTDKLVTHRVTEISPNADGTWQIEMQGDANDEPDLESYTVGESVLTPMARLPGAGKVVSKLMEPSVALPILMALMALLGLSLLDEPRSMVRRAIDRVKQPDPRLDDLDLELATVGVDVARLRNMDDLDLQMYALGVDLDESDEPVAEPMLDDTVPPRLNSRGFEDGLQAFELPPSDGIYVVRWPSDDESAPSEPFEPVDVDQRAPTRSG